MTLDRWRGTRGIVGWLVFKWDVWQIRRFARRLRKASMRSLILVAALTLAGCDFHITNPAPVVTAGTTAPGNITISNTNTNTATTDRSDTEPTPAPTGTGTPPPASGVLPLPTYGEGVARDYAAAHPNQVTHSCQLVDGEAAWQFLDGVIHLLQARDARWGYLCKDASCATKARDIVAYRASTGDTGIWIVDVLGSHCPGPGDSPTEVRWGPLPFETTRRWSGTR
jgi:hypothetical protein